MNRTNNQLNLGGIYVIFCIVTLKFYLGRASVFQVRKNKHWSQLRRGVHENEHLQRAFVKYGQENFVFDVLEVVEPNTLANRIAREQFYLDALNPWNKEIGYNISKSANYGKEDCEQNTTKEIKRCGREFEIQAPNGAIYREKGLNTFCKKHHLNRKLIKEVLSGEKNHHKGWRLPGIEVDESVYLGYEFISPVGEIVKIPYFCMNTFGKKMGLRGGGLKSLWNGVYSHYAGYTRVDKPDHKKFLDPEGKIHILGKGYSEIYFRDVLGFPSTSGIKNIVAGRDKSWKGWTFLGKLTSDEIPNLPIIEFQK